MTRLARILAVVLAAGCGAASAAAPLALHTCRLTGLDHDAQCGVLKRPLDPAKPQGTQIDLHVVVIPVHPVLSLTVVLFAGYLLGIYHLMDLLVEGVVGRWGKVDYSTRPDAGVLKS